LLFETLALMLRQQVTFAAAARLVGESWHWVSANCERYDAPAPAQADFPAMRESAIDPAPGARGHGCITLAADAVEQPMLAVAEGHSVKTIDDLASELASRGCAPEHILSVSIDVSPALFKDCGDHLPNARVAFEKFHIAWHASTTVAKMRRVEQRSDRSSKGML
jgi:transposase